MIVTAVYHTPTLAMRFKSREVELLMEASDQHYDLRCRQASQSGGFICGMNNRMAWDPDCLHDMRFDHLDTMAKICELPCHMWKGDKAAVIRNLAAGLHAALRFLNESGKASDDVDPDRARLRGLVSNDCLVQPEGGKQKSERDKLENR